MNHAFLDRLAYAVSAKSRKRKHSFFLESLHPEAHESILDIGLNSQEYSDTDNYLEKFYTYPEKITGVSLEDVTPLQERYPHSRFIQADGTNLPFRDNEFDIAYSNAVIEHVGKKEQQKKFLKELVRVSSRGYLTTPNRFFPIEVHTRVPLLHIILPKALFDAFLRLIGKKWATGDYMYLLSKRDLEALVEEVGVSHYQIKRHRFLGFTMTLTLLWKK